MFQVSYQPPPSTLGIPAGKYHKDVLPILTGQAKESRAANQRNSRIDEALKGNRETVTTPGQPAVPEQPIATESTSDAVRSRTTPAQPAIPGRTETRVKNPELDALMH